MGEDGPKAGFIDAPDTNWGERKVAADVRARLFGEAEAVRIDRFEVERTIGRGGMGEVLLAWDAKLERRVAIKLMHARLLDGGGRERVLREAQALARVSHPNVVDVYEVGEHEGQPFVAMEYVEGEALSEWLTVEARPWREIVAAFVDAGRGLAAIHRAGLVHRDFKAANVLRAQDGRIRVVDLGLAGLPRATIALRSTSGSGSEGEPLTAPGAVLGTVAFMPLEQLRGGLLDGRADQFAFCVALYRALWSSDPFSGSTLDERSAALTASGPAEPPRAELPAKLWPVVERGLAREPDARWPDMDALLRELEAVLAPSRLRRWAPLVVLPLIAAMIAGLIGVAFGRGGAEATGPEAGPVDPCAAIANRATRLWDDARASEVEAAFAATELAFAAVSFVQVSDRLGGWRDGWRDARVEVCEQGDAADEAGRRVLALRAACLDAEVSEAEALVARFADADADTVTYSVDAVSELASVDSCADERLLLGLPPVSVALEPTLADARGLLGRARIERQTGHYDRARALLEAGAGDLDEASAHPPFAAELAIERAKLELVDGLESRGFEELEAGAVLADRSRHDHVAALTWSVLAQRGLIVRADRERAAQWLERAQTASARIGDPQDLPGRIACLEGTLARHNHEHERARALLERALDQLAALDELHDWRPSCMVQLAKLQTGDEALASRERALELTTRKRGRGHPASAPHLLGLGLALERAGRGDEAAPLLEEATRIWVASHTKPHRDLATAHVLLASRALDAHRLDQARAHAEAVSAIYAAILEPGDSTLAQGELLLGAIAMEQGDYLDALDAFNRARGRVPESVHPAIDRNRAQLAMLLGRDDEAEAIILALREGPGPSEGLAPADDAALALIMAEIELRRGHASEAQHWLPTAEPGPGSLRLEKRVLSSIVALRLEGGVGGGGRACPSIEYDETLGLAPTRTHEIVARVLDRVSVSAGERDCFAPLLADPVGPTNPE